jgi:hypothetical protein
MAERNQSMKLPNFCCAKMEELQGHLQQIEDGADEFQKLSVAYLTL